MKYYSDKLDKFFDSEEECMRAEEEVLKNKTETSTDGKECSINKLKDRQCKNTSSNHKKELSKAFENAESELNEAYDKYQIAEKHAKEIYDEEVKKATDIVNEARKKYDSIMSGAKKELREKQNKRNKALAEFNLNFGPYTKVYTGEKAARETARMNNLIDSIFGADFLSNLYRRIWF